MIKRKIFIILPLLFISITSGYFAAIENNNCILFNILIGIIASSVTVICFELIDFGYDWIEYSYLKGWYKRIKIKNGLDERNENTDRKYSDMTDEYKDVKPIVHVNYKGNGKYTGELDYKEGHAKFTINLNKENKYLGSGIYYYIFKKDEYKENMPDQGKYEIVVSESEPIQIYVYFDNLIPSRLAYGYEVWKKCKKPQKDQL